MAYGMMHDTVFAGFGWLFQIVILLLLFFILWWIFSSSKTDEKAIDILKKRYARGEITKKEFLKLKKDIEG